MGGLLSLVGALVYAELATAYPEAGGDYVYLTRAFGRRLGFLFGWAQLWVVRPGSIGAMAFVFARYANDLLVFSCAWPPTGAAGERPGRSGRLGRRGDRSSLAGEHARRATG